MVTSLLTTTTESFLSLVFLRRDRKSTRLNSSHANISYAVFCLKKKIHIHYPYPISTRDGQWYILAIIRTTLRNGIFHTIDLLDLSSHSDTRKPRIRTLTRTIIH